MSFTLLHTADWQIGKPFRNFPDEISAVLRDARLEAIDRLAEIAVAKGARHVLVAGDVYDVARLGLADLMLPVERMRKHAGLVWHLLPGNHDPAGAGSLWQRLGAAGLPANIRIHAAAGPVAIEAGVSLLPAPLTGRSSADDPTLYMAHAHTPEGALRIGLAHGSVRGFGSAETAAVRIDPARVATARLDYLALGDWHGTLQVSARCWYSGTPEPDGFDDNSPGHALIVRFTAPGVPPQIERIDTRRFLWLRRTVRIDRIEDLARLESELAGQPMPGDRLIVRLELTGLVALGLRTAIERRLELLRPRFRHLATDLRQLAPAPTPDELARLSRQGEIGAASSWLGDRVQTGAAPERETAARALARLYQLVMDSEAGVAP